MNEPANYSVQHYSFTFTARKKITCFMSCFFDICGLPFIQILFQERSEKFTLAMLLILPVKENINKLKTCRKYINIRIPQPKAKKAG